MQLILWRDNPNALIQVYLSKTITYGTASAAFLTTQTLFQLPEDEKEAFPTASRFTKQDFYMDDLITGCDNVDEAKIIVNEMVRMFHSAGMTLRKWFSNSKEVLKDLPFTSNENCGVIEFGTDDTIKTMGLFWNPSKDSFQFQCNINQNLHSTSMTKRSVLSEIPKLFDPLGIISPVITSAKILMQALWQCKISWDEIIPSEMEHLWTKFLLDLTELNKISIPRFVADFNENLETHAYAQMLALRPSCLLSNSLFQ